jgi:phage terminase large subunit-like protein
MMALRTSEQGNENKDYITKYAAAIKSGKTVTSAKVKKVYTGLARRIAKPSGQYVYDNDKAIHAIEFIERFCKHSIGSKFAGKPFILELWQKAFVSAVFGFVDKDTGLRQYREAMLIIGRKNGKSTLAAAIGLYLMLADGEPGAEIYSAATKRDQAKIIWNEARRMIRKSPALSRRVKCLVSEIKSEAYNATFKPLGNDSDTLDGLNVHGALIDELHAVKDENIYNVIVDGAAAREQPLTLITTTAGTVRENIYDKKYEYAANVINGVEGFTDDQLLAVIYELDRRDEWTDPKAWEKANPGLGTIKNTATLAAKVTRAKADASNVKNLLCKDFNIRETSAAAWLSFEDLNNTNTFSVTDLRPKYAIGGVDLSKNNDLTAAKAIFKVPDDPKVYVMSMYWIPEDLLQERVREDKIPYDLWHKAGLLEVCEGNTVHPKYVTQWFKSLQEQKNIYFPYIGYDGWSAKYWVEEMAAHTGRENLVTAYADAGCRFAGETGCVQQ